MSTCLIRGGIVVTMDPQRRVLRDGAIAIRDDRIVAVGESSEVAAQYPSDRTIDARGHFCIPGLINCHNHLFAMLTRYMVVPLGELAGQSNGARMTRYWWSKFEDPARQEDAHVGTLLGGLEMLQRGCTCTADTLEGPYLIPGGLERAAQAFAELGMRGLLSFEAGERVSAENGRLGLEENANLIRRVNGIPSSLIRGAIAVHTPFSSSRRFLREARELANRLGAQIQIHIGQVPYEPEYLRDKYGAKGSIYYLDELGFLGPDVIAAHCVCIDPGEVELLAKHDVKVSFNPKSNANGGYGVAPVPELMKLGVTVGLGVDNINVLDMFELALCGSYMLRNHYMDRSLMPGIKALEMLTIDGAKVLGMEREIGSLEVGKKADLVLIKHAGKPHLTPLFEDVYAPVAYGARGSDVDTVMVDGRIVVEEGVVRSVNADAVCELAARTAEQYRARIDQAPIGPVWELPTLGRK